MAFDEIQFSPEISWGARGGPAFSTTIVTTASGDEQRNQNWAKCKGRWIVGHNLKFDSERDDLIAFFRSRRGAARGFRFKDWSDYTITDQTIGTGDASETDFQIIKTYSDDDSLNDYTRTITKPVDGTISITVAAAAQVENTDYTIDYTTGIVTFLAGHIPGVGQVIKVSSGQFDTPVRFGSDSMEWDLEHYNLSSWDGIEIVELKDTTTT